VLADGLYGTRSYILAQGYQREMDTLKQKHPDTYEDLKEYVSFEQKYKSEMGEVNGMALWGFGGAVMAIYGNRSAAKEVKSLSNKLAAYLKEEGVNLQEDALARALEEQNKTVFQKVTDFAYRYPSEIMHTCFALGSIGVINNGLPKYGKNGKKDKGYDWMTLGQGLTVLIGALIGMFVKEKTPEQLAKLGPPKNGFERAGRYLHQYANKLTSGFYLGNNAFSALRTYSDYKNFTKDNWQKEIKTGVDHSKTGFHDVWKIRAGALAVYLFGAAVLSMTSKTSGVKIDAENEADTPHSQIYQEAAEMLASMPDDMRDSYIRKTAKYLSNRRELGFTKIDAGEIAEKIFAALEEQQSLAKNNKPKGWKDRAENSPVNTGRDI
jgi:hypothetical protein